MTENSNSPRPNSAPAQSGQSGEYSLIRLGAAPKDHDEAVRMAGQILVDNGAVDKPYIDSMLKRETQGETWLADGVTIPHGSKDGAQYIRADKVAVLQVPNGVKWTNGETARLIFGIAARGDGHLTVLRRLTRLLQNPESLRNLFTTKNPADIANALSDTAAAEAKAEAQAKTAPAPKDLDVKEEWTMDYPKGLHARPSTEWISAARRAGIPMQVRNGNAVSDIKDLVSLLQIGARCGDKLVFSASGADAQAKLDSFMQVVKSLSAQEKETVRKEQAEAAEAVANSWTPPSKTAPIVGVKASPGLAIGIIHQILSADTKIADKPTSPAQDAALLQSSLQKTKQHMHDMVADVTKRLGASSAGIFKAQATLLDDEKLISKACDIILDGHGAAFAWSEAVHDTAASLRAMNNPLLAGRAADVLDVGKRVLENLDPAIAAGSLDNLPKGEKLILVAEELSPSETASLNVDMIAGLATIKGGATSHMAILANTLGIPALVAGGAPLAAVKNGAKAIINGTSGALWADPSAEDVTSAEEEIARLKAQREKQDKERHLPATTPDGKTIEIAANVTGPSQVTPALKAGAEGVGLMRSEFLFLGHDHAPDEEYQFKTYRSMVEALGNDRRLIVRTLDIGGDKQVSYLNLPHEQNPFLGVRGARLCLQRPELLYPQLTALYRAAKEGGNIHIMFPMIMSVDEVLRLKQIAEEVRQSVKAPECPIGIMVEVPSAAICADKLAKYVDFFSIGTNDLTQYTLAVDRENPVLASQSDGVHPAVLRMIKNTVEGARKYNRFVGVCGGTAGDPFAAILMMGLGVNELSMTAGSVAAVKARIRATPFAEMQELARKACDLETIKQVRALDKGMPDTAK